MEMRTRFEGRMAFGDGLDWEVLVALVPWCEGGSRCVAGPRSFVAGLCPSCGTRITIRVYPPAELAREGTGRRRSRLAVIYALEAVSRDYTFGECAQCLAFTDFFNERFFEATLGAAQVVFTRVNLRLPEEEGGSELLA